MFKFIFNLSKLLSYSFYIKKKYDYNHKISNKDLNIINKYINNCGCIVIKCVQWLIPILDKEDIDDKILNMLSNVYENNLNQDIKYTNKIYKYQFNKDISDEYDIVDVIGSGSIGQVYKIKCKKSGEKYVMKVKHPNIESQINLFRTIFTYIYNIKIFNKLFYKYFPFNLIDFLDDFYKQSDFINESNNILYFYHKYQDNPYIIIPKLIKTSENIIIMEYIDGKCLDDLDINEYNKSKIIILLYLFIRNNLLILNNNHGDLHKYNWKVSNDKLNNIYKIIIYDFGYCFKLTKLEYDNISMLCDLMVSNDENMDNYNKFLKFLYDKSSLNINVEYNNRITEPSVLLEQILKISKENNIMIKRYKVLNTLLLMSLVDTYFQKYSINNNTDILIIKKKLLDSYTFCITYKIFLKLSSKLLKEYNHNNKQTEIFESIKFGDNIRNLI
tara:strand:+ start:2673 stop:4001 length:1329 start_codon:yes stop_codon:yes gene_type:complete